MTAAPPPQPVGLLVSIVVPAHNEQDNVEPLVREVRAAVIDAGIDAELIVVDDGSTDATLARLKALTGAHPFLRLLHRPVACGQSAAMHAGVQAAAGRFVAFLDADLQNDPADLPGMLALIQAGQADMVQGDRSANRRDSIVRKFSTWIGRTFRRTLLGDPIRDTGCSARMLPATVARRLPLHFKGMHRFIPVYCRMLGCRIVEMPVHHRPRVAGVTKYGMLNRGLVGLFDCLAVRWMLRRYRDPSADPVAGESSREPLSQG